LCSLERLALTTSNIHHHRSVATADVRAGGIGMALVARTHPLSDQITDPSLPPASAPPNIVAHETMAPMLSTLRHPVVVTIAYTIDHENTDDFRAAMMKVAAARRRGGATAWVLGRDVEQPEHWLEAFRLPDWMELNRGVARVSGGCCGHSGGAQFPSQRPRAEVRFTIIEQG
jgi:hypothetical protein